MSKFALKQTKERFHRQTLVEALALVTQRLRRATFTKLSAEKREALARAKTVHQVECEMVAVRYSLFFGNGLPTCEPN